MLFRGKEFGEIKTTSKIDQMVQERIDEFSLYTIQDVKKLFATGLPAGAKIQRIPSGEKIGDRFWRRTDLNRR